MPTTAQRVMAYVSEHRFRLALAVCSVTLLLMVCAIYATIGFGPGWSGHVGRPA